MTEKSMYEQTFERNYGVFSESEQARIRASKVVIVGCGGIGGAVAVILARSGVEHFVLYDYDLFSVSNLNRQIGCLQETIGKAKAEIVRDTIVSINPGADVQVNLRMVTPDEMDDVILAGDVFMPAADEWPLSIAMLNRAKELGKPAIMAYPAGALGRVSTFLPSSPYAAECLVQPYKADYEALKTFMEKPEHRQILYYYRTSGSWTQEWFDGFVNGQLPHPQICPTTWNCAATAALEILKIFSGKWKPVAAPRYWNFTAEGAKIRRFSVGRRLLSRIIRKPSGQRIIPFLCNYPWLVRAFTRVLK